MAFIKLKNNPLERYDEMIFNSNSIDCHVANCLFNIVGFCTRDIDGIQPINSGWLSIRNYTKVECKKAILFQK